MIHVPTSSSKVARLSLKTSLAIARGRPPGHRSMTSAPSLSRLPVPDLHQTLQKYLQSIDPLLLEDEAGGGPKFAEARRMRETWAEDFERGIGRVCHERLQGQYHTHERREILSEPVWYARTKHLIGPRPRTGSMTTSG